ncbi:acyl-CoA dehydrogenase family protein [Ancylobacter oerskovii]|uniref:Acyl-CoA dehydrogenase family protein n=1 Tax=Ancylobacter oerskovii TaxID=459519 RepID=A0ABW4YWF4_9HYPH|nr:acyl-CoA dehydrogenase family protein [Ancylobacter oerskovii]MBS7544186.1 acyl-CoA dehydrogenase family protein [Ancylobacter oerskovii]
MDAINIAAPAREEGGAVKAARALAPFLREQAAEARRLRRLPASTIEAMDEAGLFRLTVPAMYGGAEASLSTLLDVTLEIGAADGSVGWTYAILAGGTWMAAALYPQEVSEEVFAGGVNVRTASVMSPATALTRRVPGGLVIEEGRWSFNSGVHHARWDVVNVPVMDEGRNVVDMAAALVPVGELTLLDDWDTIGLRGTGSVSVTARDVFVPDSRLASIGRILAEEYASAHLADRPHFRVPLVPMLAVKLAFPCLAIAREALRQFVARVPGRPVALTIHADRSTLAVTHLQVAEAAAKIDAAEAVIRRAIHEIEAAATVAPLSREQRARIWRDATFAARLAWEAVGQLADASGGGFARTGEPMNIGWHDLRTATLHAGLSSATAFEVAGRVMFGLPSNTPFL